MKKLFQFLLLSFVSSPAFASISQTANQQDIHRTYLFLICINALFFTGILVAMTVYLINHRKAGLDMLWSMLPAIMLIVVFGLGWINFHDNHLGETFYAVKFSQ